MHPEDCYVCSQTFYRENNNITQVNFRGGEAWICNNCFDKIKRHLHPVLTKKFNRRKVELYHLDDGGNVIESETMKFNTVIEFHDYLNSKRTGYTDYDMCLYLFLESEDDLDFYKYKIQDNHEKEIGEWQSNINNPWFYLYCKELETDTLDRHKYYLTEAGLQIVREQHQQMIAIITARLETMK
jgi:hypothetical protein